MPPDPNDRIEEDLEYLQRDTYEYEYTWQQNHADRECEGSDE